MDTSQIDLMALVGIQLKKTTTTNGGEYHGACPFCGGNDRFWIVPNKGRWYCRHCTPKGGSAIDFVMQRDNCDFKTACHTLGLEVKTRHYIPKPKPEPQPARVKNTDLDKLALNPDWQAKARGFVQQAQDNLKQQGKPAWDYLNKRGIHSHIALWYGLGFNPKPYRATWAGEEVYLPSGLVLPWFGEYDFDLGDWNYNAIRVRPFNTPTNGQKYSQVKGAINSLYDGSSADNTYEDKVVFLVEGEIDSQSIATACYLSRLYARDLGFSFTHRVHSVALGSSAWGRTLTSIMKLGLAKRVIIATDDDTAGDECATWWLENLDNAIRWRPAHHDPNDMLTLNWMDLAHWMKDATDA